MSLALRSSTVCPLKVMSCWRDGYSSTTQRDGPATVPVNTRWHGTAMASLVVHGDLSAAEAPIAEPVYLRPILAE